VEDADLVGVCSSGGPVQLEAICQVGGGPAQLEARRGTTKLEGERQEGMMQLNAIVETVVVAALAVGRCSCRW
jgi:hypothetical protein